MANCKICGRYEDRLYTISVDGQELSNVCETCLKTIKYYRTSDSQNTVSVCRTRLQEVLANPQTDDEARSVVARALNSRTDTGNPSVQDDFQHQISHTSPSSSFSQQNSFAGGYSYSSSTNSFSNFNRSPNTHFTSVLRGIAMLFLGLATLAGVIIGGVVGSVDDLGGALLGALLGGMIAFVTTGVSVALIMTIVEISENTAKNTELLQEISKDIKKSLYNQK